MAKGIEETNVIDLVSPPSGAHLVSGLGDIAGFRHDDLTQAPATMFTNPNYPSTESLDFAELNQTPWYVWAKQITRLIPTRSLSVYPAMEEKRGTKQAQSRQVLPEEEPLPFRRQAMVWSGAHRIAGIPLCWR